MSPLAVLLALAAAPADSWSLAALDLPANASVVLSDDLDGDGLGDLLFVAGRDAAVYFLSDGTTGPAPDLTFRIAADAVFLDLGDVDGDPARELVVLTRGGVEAYRFGGRRVAGPTLVAGPAADDVCLYPVADSDVMWNDFLLDLDGAGAEDVVLPTDAGYRVYLRGADPLAFAPAGVIPVLPGGALSLSPGSDLGAVEQTLEMPRIFTGNVTGDARPEVLTFDGHSVCAYRRPDAPDGEWPLVLERTLYEGEASLAESLFSSRNVRIEDLDATGLSCLLVVRSLEGAIDFFSRAAGAADSAPEAEPLGERRTLKLGGWILPPKLIDLDGDQRIDLLAPTVEAINPLKLMRIFATKSFTMKYSIFRNRDGVRYARTPDEVREITFPLQYETEGMRPSVAYQMVYSFDGDFDGDGAKDFMAKTAPARLDVFRGTGAGSFGKEPAASIAIDDATPFLALEASVYDLNRDGRSDLLLRYRAREGGADRFRLHLSGAKP